MNKQFLSVVCKCISLKRICANNKKLIHKKENLKKMGKLLSFDLLFFFKSDRSSADGLQASSIT